MVVSGHGKELVQGGNELGDIAVLVEMVFACYSDIEEVLPHLPDIQPKVLLGLSAGLIELSRRGRPYFKLSRSISCIV